MALKEKASELRQTRAKLLDEARTLVEKVEKDQNGVFTAEQRSRYDWICGDTKENGGEAYALAQRISQITRTIAVDTLGSDDPGRRSAPLPHEDPGNVGTRHRYSLMRAVRQMASKGAEPFSGLEAEVSQEIGNRSAKSPQGFFMPYRSSGVKAFEAERRALDGTTGGGSVPTILDKDWIELLRNKMILKQAGMREILDIQGKFAIPRQNAAATAYWVAESGAPTGTNQTLDQVLFTPHTVGAFTDISRRFFELTILDSGEEFVKEDLTAILARGIDLAGLNGSGGSSQPLGILQNTAITATRTVLLGSGAAGAPTWAKMVALHTLVNRGNAADLGEFTYIGSADVRGTLATTLKASTFPIFLLENDKVYNMPFLSTQQVPSNLTAGSTSGTACAMVCGIFNQLITAYWSGVDILVDPYTGSSSGTVRVVALQDLDIQVRHPEAFAVVVDFLTNQT